MRKEELERLRFRNQYLLVTQPIQCPFLYREYQIGTRYHLYAHVDLNVSVCESRDAVIFLLGDIFDYRRTDKSNQQILKDLLQYGFEGILNEIGEYTGRYVLIYHQGPEFKLVHDATAARRIYYGEHADGVWFSSRPRLLAQQLGFEKTTHPEILEYYRSDVFAANDNCNIGDYTIYDGIRQLMPNHFYDAGNGSMYRFWPSERIVIQSMKQVAERCALMIKGYVESIVNRYEVMLPVTGGKDSRTLLAASRGVTDRVYYYINNEKHLHPGSPDIAIPLKLFKDNHLQFHILDPYGEIDEDFRRVYFENNEYASERFLPHIYHYYLHFSDKVNLPGHTAAAGHNFFLGIKSNISGENLARRYHVDRWKFAVEYYERWMKGIHNFYPDNNVPIHNLFYWEERIANWGGQVQLDKDIAQEDINPFNSRNLVMEYLSVHPKHMELPIYRMYKEIIRQLWPELLKQPINKSFKKSVLKVMKIVGVMGFYYRLKYRNY